MNSCVPNVFGSVTPPQFGLSVTARFGGPMPLRQWYSSAKHPPGQRTLGTFSALSAATTSFRIPRVFGMGESGPTQTPSYMPWPRCSANCPKMLRSIVGPAVEASTTTSILSAAVAGAATLAYVSTAPATRRRTLEKPTFDARRQAQIAWWPSSYVAIAGLSPSSFATNPCQEPAGCLRYQETFLPRSRPSVTVARLDYVIAVPTRPLACSARCELSCATRERRMARAGG